MRLVTYTIQLKVPDDVDFEAATTTFEQYIEDYNEDSGNEWPMGPPAAEIKAIEN